MTIDERRFGDVTLLNIEGRVVYGDGAQQLREHISNLIDGARLKFLLDLRGVTYIDSFGVGVIAAKYVSLRRKGGDLKLVHPSERVPIDRAAAAARAALGDDRFARAWDDGAALPVEDAVRFALESA